MLNSGDVSTQLASEASRGKTLTHVDQSPPRDLIAVGDQALAAYFTSRQVKQPNRDQIMTRTYSVLDQKTGRYEVDARWAYLAVAPGMRTAAVLERQLPVTRIGVLDLLTKKVTRWIPMEGLDGVSARSSSRRTARNSSPRRTTRILSVLTGRRGSR